MIRRFRWLISVMFSLHTVFLLYPQKKKKSRGVRSGLHAGHRIGPSRPIHELGNLSLKTSRTDREKRGGTPSCMKTMLFPVTASKSPIWMLFPVTAYKSLICGKT
ncbi:hypothetical protein AVEN_166336-1 [Araneus ventricosus]|uniref:Uncharacterized protein n=1 Tax=Araneus ventricosus TaxID=182803 RepID=A0A4Y2TG02_ARAVE|nr:hypothetical protein AVEN_166336-1 [Araneus ventricosus]